MIRKIVVFACLCAISSSAFAATLSDFHFAYGGGWKNITDTGYLRMAMGSDGSFLPTEYFNVLAITPADTDLVFSITGEAFDHFESYLTNGVNDYVGFLFCAEPVGGNCVGFASSEASRLGGNPDFSGKAITGLELRVNSLTLETPAHDPNGDGIWTNFDLDMNFVVSGSVIPVPAAVWLFGSALASLGWMKRKD
jgi:hypothetical protein